MKPVSLITAWKAERKAGVEVLMHSHAYYELVYDRSYVHTASIFIAVCFFSFVCIDKGERVNVSNCSLAYDDFCFAVCFDFYERRVKYADCY